MKNLAELREYYEKVLVPELEVLEVKRVRNLIKITVAGVAIGALTILLTFLLRHPAPAVFGIILFLFAVKFISAGYVFDFKSGIIEKIVTCVDETLKYSKTGKIPEGDFMLSNIFRKQPDRYNGDDLVTGKIGETGIRFSEVHAEHETRDSRGRRSYHTIFKGLFFIADFNKKFKGMTMILPDRAERLFGHVGTMLQSMNKGRGELIKLEDPEFEKLFAVYGMDQIEARYILSTSLMKRIVDFQKKHRRPLHISFIGNKIYIAIGYSRDLFEPRIFRTVVDFAPIKTYYEDLQLAVGIVDDLNLNLRIWGDA